MITLEHVSKSFDDRVVLRDVSLEIPQGRTTAIIGRSGAGKSVLLKLIVGLLEPDEGMVGIDSMRVTDLDEAGLYQLRSSIGYVFQGAALFDSMTVAENLVLGLTQRGEHDPDVLRREISSNLVNVGLLPDPDEVSKLEFSAAYAELADRMPSELSGGMRKRVGVARALVGRPRYLLYDEPTTGLDPVTSEQIDDLVVALTRKLHVTSVVITHDIFSVYKVADKVVMLHDGQVRFDGTPEELRTSDDPVVREFIERYALTAAADRVARTGHDQ